MDEKPAISDSPRSDLDEIKEMLRQTNIRIGALEVQQEHLLGIEANRRAESDAERSRQFQKQNKPRFDWLPIFVVAVTLGGIGYFLYYWITQHKGLH